MEDMMDIKKIISAVDDTMLSQTATWADIRRLCDEAAAYGTASVCIPPSFVKRAKDYLGNRMVVCTVVGFPNGYNTKEVKVYETKNAFENGADEIDMVVNLGNVKDKKDDEILEEIKAVKHICKDKVLKVIIETCFLNKDEKIRMCRMVTESGADFIKTSTGFSKGGAVFEDIELFQKHIGKGVGIKAAGGINSFEDAAHFMALGASRLGTSKLVSYYAKHYSDTL